MKKAKQYKPKPVTHKLIEKIWDDRGGFIGASEKPERVVVDAHPHSETTWQCKYCTRRFFFRPEAICIACGLCQSCGIYHEDHTDTGCLCGNRLDDTASAIIRRVVRPKAQE